MICFLSHVLSRCVRALVRFALIVCCVLGVGAAMAQNLLLEQGVLRDRTGLLTIEEAAQASYAPLSGLLVGGYTADVFWLKLVVQSDPQGGAVQLRIRPTYLDELRLYEATPDGGWRERISGDRHRSTPDDLVGTSQGFRLAATANATTTYFLRLSTTSSAMMRVEAIPQGRAVQLDAELVVWKILFVAFMLWLAVWALQDYLQNKAVVSLAFGVYQVAHMVYAFFVLGFTANLPDLGSAADIDRYTSWSVFGSVFFGLFFHLTVFHWVGLRGWRLRLIGALIVATSCAFLAYELGWQREALQGNALIVMVAGPLFAALAWLGRFAAPTPAQRMVRWIYALQLASLLVSMAPLLGWVQTESLGLYSPMLHGLISAALMFYLMSTRSWELRVQQDTALKESALAHQQLQLQRQYTSEQGQFIDMLTHELKTPVAVALMSLDRIESSNAPYVVRIRRALTNINGIVERARWSDMLAHQRVKPALHSVSLSEYVFEAVEATLEPERSHVRVIQPAEVSVDPQFLSIVLSNLLDNALKYSPQDSPVHIQIDHGLSKEGRLGVEVAVSNQIGQAGRPDVHRLFSKYYRSAGAGAISGSGLGLYLTQQLASLLGGHVSWRGRDQQAVFVLWLPL